MPRKPKYRRHSTGKAFIEANKKRIYLPGKYDSEESRDAYDAFIRGEWPPPRKTAEYTGDDPPLLYLANRFLDYAKTYYGQDPDNNPRATYWDYYRAVRFVTSPDHLDFAQVPASQFGPAKLKDLQSHLTSIGLARTTINGVATKVRTWIKWCVSSELCDASILHGLQSVRGLEEGRCDAHDPEPREPACWEDVQPVFRHLQPTTRDMLWLQWYSGARSRSICEAKPEQFTRDNEWNLLLWRPRHKTERRRKIVLPLGPRCYAHIRDYLNGDADAFCFSPKNGRNASNPMYRDCYDPDTYRRAIHRAIKAAQEWAKKKDAYVPERWSPHQLRHSRGTIVRERYGIEAASAVLGHASVDVTELYSARAIALAKKVAVEMG